MIVPGYQDLDAWAGSTLGLLVNRAQAGMAGLNCGLGYSCHRLVLPPVVGAAGRRSLFFLVLLFECQFERGSWGCVVPTVPTMILHCFRVGDSLFFSLCCYLVVNLSVALEGVLFPQFPRWFCIVLEWKACRHFLQCCVLLAQSICSRPPSATSSLFDCVHDTAVPRFFFSLCCLNTVVSLCNVAASVTWWFQILVPLHYFWGVDDCDVCSNLTRLFLVFFYFSLRMLVCTPVVVSHIVFPQHPRWSSNFVSRSLVGNLCIVVYCLPSPRMQYTADLSILSLEGW